MKNYQKESIIGRGAYGTVFLCSHKRTKKEYILKEIPMDTVNDEERATALNEVQILKVLNHPNIVLYIDSALESQALLIVMEYVNGGTLHDFLLNQSCMLEEVTVINFFAQLVVALSHIHSKNVLHRDLKTQNLLIDRQHKIIKISDFGISKVLSSKSKAMSVVGTPCYISPEVCEHSPYNQKSDIWAVGCILFELMTLKRAFEARNLPALVTKIMRADYPAPPPKYSSQLRALMSKCLSLEPHRRPNTSQILCDPLIHRCMLLLYSDIGAYNPSFKLPTRQAANTIENFPVSVPNLSGHHSKVFLWGDGHITPAELNAGTAGFISTVSIGRGTRCGLTNQGALIVWDCSVDTNGLPTYKARKLSDSKFKSMSAGQGFLAAVTDKGVLVIARVPVFDIEIVESLLGLDCAQCAAGEKSLYILSMEGEIWKVFDDIQVRTAKQFRPVAIVFPGQVKITSLVCGPDAVGAITSDGKCFVFGKNHENRLHLDAKLDIDSFQEVQCDFKVKTMSIGPSHSAYISNVGELYLIGANKYGALGDSFSHSRSLVKRTLNSKVIDVAVGPHYTCAICTDGSVWSWGKSARGQLGRNPEPQDSPRRVNVAATGISISTHDGITLLSAKRTHNLKN